MTYYVNIMDLLFNGEYGCDLLEERPQNDPYITIKKEYSRGRDNYIVTYKYKNILLTMNEGYVTFGALRVCLEGLRGKGVHSHFSMYRGDIFIPFTPEQERVVKRLGIWVF